MKRLRNKFGFPVPTRRVPTHYECCHSSPRDAPRLREPGHKVEPSLSGAANASAVSLCELVAQAAQATTRRAYRSRIAAGYSHPSQVAMAVTAVTQTRSGASTRKFLLNRLGAIGFG